MEASDPSAAKARRAPRCGGELLQAVCVLFPAAAFDARPWLDDLRQLTSEISAHYANLDWAVEHRRMDLPKLREDTEARLRAATSEQEARAALQRFVDVFGDGHLTIEWPKPEAPSATPPASSLCARLGYRRPSSPGIDFSQVAGFTPLGAEPLPHGLLRLGRRTVGVLRIAPFSEHSSPEVCQDVVREMRLDTSAPCDSTCADSIDLASANRLTAEIDRRARQPRPPGPTPSLGDLPPHSPGADSGRGPAH